MEPDNPFTLNNRGSFRAAHGDVAGAREDYDTAIRLKPDYVDAFNNRGILRVAQGDYVGAQQDFDTAKRLREEHARVTAPEPAAE